MINDFPFINPTANQQAEELAEPREYAWDFVNDRFIYDNKGNHIIVTQNEAIKVWIYKAIKTERFVYLAYSWRFGIELKPFIGKVMSVQERYSELKRIIIECLMVNPYIQAIKSIEFSTNKTEVICTIEVQTIYGEVVINV